MKNFIRYWDNIPSTKLVFTALLAALACNVWATHVLNASYAASQFPVPYFEAQLSFDAARLKGWYAVLMERGTLDVYVRTQHLDYLFIVSTAFLHFLALVFVARLLPVGSRWRGVLLVCAVLSVIAPLADALENAVSYAMLAAPGTFHAAWAYLYSSFAAIKFAMFMLAYVVTAVGLMAAAVMAWRRRCPASEC